MISRLLYTALVVSVLSALVVMDFERRWRTPLAIQAGGMRFTVEPGDTLKRVVARLDQANAVPYPEVVLAYARWSGLDSKIKRGEYMLPQYLSVKGLLQRLSEGRVIQRQITFPEGITLARALNILSAAEGVERTLEGEDDARIGALTSAYPNSEGWFFPDSYQYELGDTDWGIVQRAFERMGVVLNQEWENRDAGLPYESPYEALIMASIIERETGQESERTEIAGVFVRRLQKRMRLQTDPTVIYGMGKSYQGNLRRSDLLNTKNVYNTYRHTGLPPTPISLPGQKAIHAALHPAEGDTLFFVARGDGSHQFSVTLKAHEAAVRKFQLQRRVDYRSSPTRQD